MGKPFLDFYSSRKIIPVRQDISDLDLHFQKRSALYRHLGMPPAVFKERRVLEFGPGSGDDAVHTSTLNPALYVLVDGNPYSVNAVREKIDKGAIVADKLECIESEIFNFSDDRLFDVVTCEGVVPGQENTADFLRHISSFVDVDGIVMLTTHSPTSLLAEICRRMIKPLFAKAYPNPEEELKRLVEFFTPDLDSLQGMTRIYEDWVLDTIVHPWKREVVFTIPDAIDALDENFDALGTSPSFSQDWRWYKAVPQDTLGVNGHVRAEYNKWSAYFLDYRVEPGKALDFCSKTLEESCADIHNLHIDIWEADNIGALPVFLGKLSDVADTIATDMAPTAVSIGDYIDGMQGLINGNFGADFGNFRPWFGRGMQYISLMRRPLKTG